MSSYSEQGSDKSVHSDTEEKFDDASADIPPEGQAAELYGTEFKSTDAKKLDRNLNEDGENDKTETRLKSADSEIHQNCTLCKYFYVIGDATYAVHAQEPWPKDVKLFQPCEDKQILLSDNANCLAVQTFLTMCNLDFQIESRSNTEYMSPTGKVPFIKCGTFLVAELEGIVAFVAQKGISLSEHLDCEQKADLRAYQALVNNVLGAAENYVSWCDRKTYREVTKPRNGSVYPWPLNLMQNWSKRVKQTKMLKTLGWYQKTMEEVLQEVERCFQALTDRLENNIYFFGNKFTELDALLYGHLHSLLSTHLSSRQDYFLEILSKFDRLMKHYKRIDTNVMKRKVVLPPEDTVDEREISALDITANYEGNDDQFQGHNDVFGDADRDSDWFVLDKKVDVDLIGDTVTNN